MIANESEAERNAAFGGVAHGRSHAGVGNGHDEIGFGRSFPRQLSSQTFAADLHRTPEHHAVGPREIHVLENAARLRRHRSVEPRRDAFGSDDHQLARLDLAFIGSADQIEGASFGGKYDGVLPLPFEARNSSHVQGTETAGIARRKHPVRTEHHQRKRAFDAAQRIGHRVRQSLFFGERDQVNDDFGVAVGLENRTLGLQAMPDFVSIHQVAVVGQRNHAFVRLHHDGLSVEES